MWLLPWHLAVLRWLGSAKRQVVLLTIIVAAAVIAMGIVTQNVYFSRADGHPLRYYIQTLDDYKFSATPGIDPVYGIQYQPITAETERAYIVWKARSGQIQDPAVPEGLNFNPATGEPMRWYTLQPGR